MSRPKVYIIKEQVVRGAAGPIVVDYSPAMEYGDIEFITQTDMPLYAGSSVQHVWNEDVRRFLKAYDSQRDYIITTGQPAAIFCVGWALAHTGKHPRFLIWRREENRYRPLDFDPDMPVGRGIKVPRLAEINE